MSCGIFVQFFKCEVLMLGKFVSFTASCTLCTAEVESVEAKRAIRLTGGRPPVRQASWTTGDALGITERTMRVLSWIFYLANGRKISSLSGNILRKIL
jgi:hypothetical protein